ncbi:HNH endonuclease [Paramixta manurensis]|uniref:HNH endonuclease n=1 Tax=Paramixta manurensis TaxID=2740817 RepID=A0A6M8UGV8_9GAMM|nr:HNH endonuclease [Erwiniaceae bacterium PD-1]
MSFSLPGTDLWYLARDNLAPERYEEIISPCFAWWRICKEYEFDDSYTHHLYLINMRPREGRVYTHQAPPHGPREQEKLKNWLYGGQAVMLDNRFSSGNLFYIDDQGQLICRDPLAFRFSGAERIIKAYNLSVSRRDYTHNHGRPRPTVRPPGLCLTPPKNKASKGTINSRAAGRLLAAGGIYHQNPQMFADTARKLGGEAAEGFEQVLNPQTVGSLVALSSILLVGRASLAGRPSLATLEELNDYLGKTKGNYKLLSNIEVIKMDYVRRGRDELATLRNKFTGEKAKFLRSIVDDPEIKKRLSSIQLAEMAKGKNPAGWDVHHKLPLDDSGTNDFRNLVLIPSKSEHLIFTKAQKTITKDMATGSRKQVLWPVPKGIIYP